MTSQPPITDSPWLWFALFSGVGLTALVLTGGKLGVRQVEVERKGQAQEAVVEGIEVHQDDLGRKTVENPPDYSRPGHVQIHFGPLEATIGVVCALSLAMFVRERFLLTRKTDS